MQRLYGVYTFLRSNTSGNDSWLGFGIAYTWCFILVCFIGYILSTAGIGK